MPWTLDLLFRASIKVVFRKRRVVLLTDLVNRQGNLFLKVICLRVYYFMDHQRSLKLVFDESVQKIVGKLPEQSFYFLLAKVVEISGVLKVFFDDTDNQTL